MAADKTIRITTTEGLIYLTKFESMMGRGEMLSLVINLNGTTYETEIEASDLVEALTELEISAEYDPTSQELTREFRRGTEHGLQEVLNRIREILSESQNFRHLSPDRPYLMGLRDSLRVIRLIAKETGIEITEPLTGHKPNC